MLFGSDKTEDSYFQKLCLMDYTYPYIGEVIGTGEWGLDSVIKFEIPQIDKRTKIDIKSEIAQKLKQNLGIGNFDDLNGREFFVYIMSRQKAGAPEELILNLKKLEDVCFIEPVEDFLVAEEIDKRQKIVEAWQNYCYRSQDPTRLGRGHIENYYFWRTGIYNSRVEGDEKKIERSGRKASQSIISRMFLQQSRV